MNEIIEGIVQGITEFLPISSSGHIVFLKKITNFSANNLQQLQIALHLGTLLSIIVYYFNDIKSLVFNINKNRQFFSFIVLGTLPLIIIYLFFYDTIIKNILNDVDVGFDIASYCILITGFILLITKEFKTDTFKTLTYSTVLIIGFMQSLAILPGISRSGITICSALILGINSKEAAKFSFFLAIPAILGAGILEVKDIIVDSNSGPFPYIGFITSFIIGYISLKLLISIIYKEKLWYFSIYCFIIGLGAIFLF